MIRQLGVFSLLALGLFACGPDAETYLNRAQNALKEEGSDSALGLYQKAFDLSLPEEFYLTGPDEVYSEMDVSLNGKRALLTRTNAGGKESSYHILDTDTGEEEEREMKGSIRFAALSPRGKFAVFITSALSGAKTPVVEASCLLIAGDLEAKELSFQEVVNCMEKPGVSDEGRLYFMKEGEIFLADLTRNTKARLLSEKIPDAPVSGIPAWGWFQFSLDNVAFFTYGSAGIYKLYRINQNNFQMLDKSGAFGRIYFIPGNPHPGMVTGGAGAHMVQFFDRENGNVVSKYPNHFWMDAAFFSKDNYYYLENSRLYASPGEKAHNIWARKIYRAGQNTLLILTPQGALLRYSGQNIPEKASAVFLKGWDL